MVKNRITMDGDFELLNHTPWCMMWRANRNLNEPFQDFDPEPMNMTEWGGNLSHRPMGQSERIRFMPVEDEIPGNRDQPSDTDSDGKDELARGWTIFLNFLLVRKGLRCIWQSKILLYALAILPCCRHKRKHNLPKKHFL